MPSTVLSSIKALLGGAIQRARWRIRSRLGAYPIYLALLRRRHPDKTVGPDTTLIIEGYPRSGNTFAETAFRMAQPVPVQLAHHLHIPAQVIRGVEQTLPVLLLVRPPDDAVLSFVIKTGGNVSLAMALRYYIRFYEVLLRYRERIVIARFDELITDFGQVIHRLNAHYGTHFIPFPHTKANVDACFSLIDRRFQGANGVVSAGSVGRPSQQRRAAKAALRRTLRNDPGLRVLRNRAQWIYATYANALTVPPVPVPIHRTPPSTP